MKKKQIDPKRVMILDEAISSLWQKLLSQKEDYFFELRDKGAGALCLWGKNNTRNDVLVLKDHQWELMF